MFYYISLPSPTYNFQIVIFSLACRRMFPFPRTFVQTIYIYRTSPNHVSNTFIRGLSFCFNISALQSPLTTLRLYRVIEEVHLSIDLYFALAYSIFNDLYRSFIWYYFTSQVIDSFALFNLTSSTNRQYLKTMHSFPSLW